MRRFLLMCTLALAWLLALSTPVRAQFYQQHSRGASAPPPAVNHFSWGSGQGSHVMHPSAVASPPAATVPNQPSSPIYHHHHHQGYYGGSSSWLQWSAGYPYFVSGFYTPAFPYSPYSYYVPPVIAPAPQPMDAIKNDQPAQLPAPAKTRVTNPEQKAKAGKFIGYGDVNFGKQKYLPAVERYKTAAQLAPDVAESYFRQGYALVALGHFESAAKAFRRGLKIRPDWSDSAFRLDQIYGEDRLAKTSHLENLAKAVEANPLDSDLLLALGMQLYFDGQQERAGVFFARASQLGGNEDRLLDGFLAKPGPAGAPKAKVVF